MALLLNDKEIAEFLETMAVDTLDEKNKRLVMKTLANKFIGFKPASLYQVYERYKKTKRKASHHSFLNKTK